MIKKKILIVDDDPGVIAFLENKLTSEGFDVIKCIDGTEALAQIRITLPDLIIVDRFMPKIDGMKVVALLKADKRFNKIPIIMFTASADKKDQKLSESVGVNAFVTKPFNTPTLMEKVIQLLANTPK